MAIAYDASSSGITSAAGTSITVSHTVASGSDRVLLVQVAWDANNDEAGKVTGVTYNGVALTHVSGSDNHGSRVYWGGGGTDLWYLVAPDTGTHDAVVTGSTATYGYAAGVSSFTGVDQSTPLGTAAINNGVSTTPSVVVSSATDELVAGISWTYAASAGAYSSNDTEMWESFGGVVGGQVANGARAAGAASVTLDWAGGDGSIRWYTAGVPLKPVAASGGTATLSSTEAADTLSGAAVNGVAVTSSISEAADTVSATATVASNAKTADLSATEAADTLSGASVVQAAATAAISEAADTVSTAAVAAIAVTASITEAADTISATATSIGARTSDLAVTEAADTVSGAAVLNVGITGSITESADTLSGASQIQLSANYDSADEGDSLSATGLGGTGLIEVPSVTTGAGRGFGRRKLRILPDDRMVWATEDEIVQILQSFYKEKEEAGEEPTRPFATKEQVIASNVDVDLIKWGDFVGEKPQEIDLRTVPRGVEAFSRSVKAVDPARMRRKKDDQDFLDILDYL